MKAFTWRRVLAAVVLVPLLLAAWVWVGLPSRSAVRALAETNPGETGVMRQRLEEAEAEGRKLRLRRTWVPVSRISRNLIHAVVTAEDAKFFGHEGVDWEAVQQSWEKNWKEKRFARGGSTITQQLAKNLFFTTRKDPVRKVRELIVARWLEEDMSKRRILEIYLNVIEWGDGVFGAQAAAQAWYGQPASSLDETQAAGLAAMIPNPRVINPRSSPRSHAQRQRRILWQMARAGWAKRSLGVGSEPPPPAEEEDAPPPSTAGPGPAEEEAAPTPSEPEPTEPTAEPEGTDPTPEPEPADPTEREPVPAAPDPSPTPPGGALG